VWRDLPVPAREPELGVEPGAVREQLERMLSSPLFRTSKRCAPFLRYVVMEALEGRAKDLKERRIGMDVFGRDPGYDTASDPIVRTTAVEVRKRIAQYYYETERESEIQIDMAAGSYAPHFQPANASPAAVPAAPVVLPAEPAPPAIEPDEPSKVRPWRLWSLLAAAVVLVAVVGAVLIGGQLRPTPLETFWAPLWGASDTITLGIGDPSNAIPPNPAASLVAPSTENSRDTLIGFVDSLATAQVVGLLASRGKKFDVRLSGSLTLQDLKRAPAVMVGTFSNVWTMRLQSQLRFSLHTDPAVNRTWVEDRQKPGPSVWKTSRNQPYSQRTEDYAVISRFVDSRTQQPVLLLAGVGGGATRAAGEFVTQPIYLKALAARAPKDWGRKNLQVVISVELLDGNIGSPHILAVHFW
jgi:hypothetical protein